jgi:hypothetical protein
MTNPFALDTPAPPTPPSVTTDLRGAGLVASADTPPRPAAPPAQPIDDDPFSGPALQEARGPRIRDCYNRLLLIVPHKLEEGIPNRLQPGQTQDRMTADVVVLDGGPINYGGKPEATPSVPHNKVAGTPHKTNRMFISQVGIISQCREALARRAQGKPGMVLGRLSVGEAPKPGQNPPYLLQPPTDADKTIARSYLATVDPFA